MILFMGFTRHIYLNGPSITGNSKEIITFFSTLVSDIINYSGISKPMIIKKNLHYDNGFSYNKNYKGSNDLILISTWDNSINQCIIKLVKISNGKILHKWVPNIKIINKFTSVASSENWENAMLLINEL